MEVIDVEMNLCTEFVHFFVQDLFLDFNNVAKACETVSSMQTDHCKVPPQFRIFLSRKKRR